MAVSAAFEAVNRSVLHIETKNNSKRNLYLGPFINLKNLSKVKNKSSMKILLVLFLVFAVAIPYEYNHDEQVRCIENIH